MIQQLKRYSKRAMVRIQCTKRMLHSFVVGKVDMVVAGAGTGKVVE
jgi:hypothetical protein